MADLETKKLQRYRFLRNLYEATEGCDYKRASMASIGDALGLDRAELRAVANYLSAEGLLKYQGMNGEISLTHYGVREFERTLEEPETPTQYFPVNVIQVGNMESGAQIEQGTVGSHQTSTIGVADPTTLRELITSVRAAIPHLDLAEGHRSEIGADLATLEAQLESPKPKRGIVRECLESIRATLEGAAGSTLAHQLIETIKAMG